MFCPFDGTRLEESVWVAPTDPTVDPLLGTLVDGRYRVERVLGEGGSGTVYEVTHETLRRTFAMKVLRREVASDHTLSDRFMQEARATAALKHPHIVSITDFGQLDNDIPYFVMERLVGQTLAQLTRGRGPLPLERSVRIVLQVADALTAAHEAGIIHRDLKPENLFLVGSPSSAGGGDDVRVVDFGAAKIAGATRITKTGIVFGTPHYMSPEQASGQSVDHRADIYALGVVMYELFSGSLPFEADTLMGVLTKHMFVDAPPFRARAEGETDSSGAHPDPRLLAALESVTMRALAKRPDDRIQTMSGLVRELEQAVAFDQEGRVSLAATWRPPPRTKPAALPIEGLPRTVEGADRAEVYPSGDLPVLPKTSWRGSALVAFGVVVFMAVLVVTSLLRGPSNASARATVPPADSAPAPAASTSATPGLAALHVTATPPFAEVWQGGHRVGTTPIDLPVDPTGKPSRCTLRAPGFVERELTYDRTSPGSMQVTLDPVASAQPPSPPHRPTTAPHKRHSSDGELVDPFSR
jgi:serine/threonine-protein kinase